MSFHNPELEAKYRSLGFAPRDYGMKIRIGRLELDAVEHPFKGVALFFTCYAPRTMTQFEIAMAVVCSTEQIAGLIYVNFVHNFREDAQVCRRYFQDLKIPLLQ